MRFLVTGTGRCGTLFAAKYLQALGLDVQHEKYGKDGTVNWWLTCPWPLCPAPKFDKILHIYREPLGTISSLTTCPLNHEIWKHIIPNSPVAEDDPLLVRCMKHWLYWNIMGEAIADKSMRVETWNLPEITDFFGLDNHGIEPNIPTTTHTWNGQHKEYAWGDLAALNPELTRLIRKQARRYGYEIPYEADLDNRQHL